MRQARVRGLAGRVPPLRLDFCADCLVYSFGPNKPPYCVSCALGASGVRANAAVPDHRLAARDPAHARRSASRRRKAAKAAPAPVEVEIDITAPDPAPVLVPDAAENPFAWADDPSPASACRSSAIRRAVGRAGPTRRAGSSGRTGQPAISLAVVGELGRQVGVGDGQHLHDEQRGVHRAVDRDGGDRDALRHLHGGVERVDAVEGAARQRHADDRQRGVGGDDAGEVGGHAGAADERRRSRSRGRSTTNSATSAGLRWADSTRTSASMPNSARVSAAGAILSLSLGDPIRTATFMALLLLVSWRRVRAAASVSGGPAAMSVRMVHAAATRWRRRPS